MKAGRYWIGDLCYVFTDSEWDQVCSLNDNGMATLADGREFCTFYTAYGDGTYHDQSGNKYAVDSGSIGCILADSITPDSLGNIVDIPNDFEPYEDNGVLVFAHVEIDTTE